MNTYVYQSLIIFSVYSLNICSIGKYLWRAREERTPHFDRRTDKPSAGKQREADGAKMLMPENIRVTWSSIRMLVQLVTGLSREFDMKVG